MKYQIVVNTTIYHDKYSHEIINNIFIKILQSSKLNEHENNLYVKCKYYSIILFSNKTFEKTFFGKVCIVEYQIDIDNILKDNLCNLSIQNLDQINSENNFVCPRIVDGLGNRLFQLLSTFNHANKYNKKFALNAKFVLNNNHSKINYHDTIFSNFTITNCFINAKFKEQNCFLFEELPVNNYNTLYIGYLQNEKYLDDICLNFFDIMNIEKCDILKASIFIHLRLGDYYDPAFFSFFDIGLLNNNYRYYTNALNKYDFDLIKHIYVLSNDLEKAKTIIQKIHFISTINIIYVDKNEIESLNIMMNCELGGIGANSTFSWWGAYLNNIFNNCPKKIFVFPKKWTNMHNETTCNIHFTGSTLIDY